MASRTAVRRRAGPSRRPHVARHVARKPTPDGDARQTLRVVRPPLAEQFHVAVDRQLKSGHATFREAEEAALAIKRRHPRLDVTVYDVKDDRHTAVELPAA